MKVRTIKGWFLVHKWTSLVCTPFLLLLCLTGLPLVFHHEIDHALGYSVEPPEIEGEAGRASVDAILADARSRKPGHAVQFLVRDAEEPELWFVRMAETPDAPEESAFFYYDARTGDYLHSYPLGEGVMNVLFRLHFDLYAGLPGNLFLGAMGLLFVAALVSGTVLYGPFMRKLRFGTVRYARGRRIQWLDLHNLVGIATLVWMAVVGLTGAVNTLAGPIFQQWQSTQLAEMTAGAEGRPPLEETASVDAVLESVRSAAPGRELSFMAFPGNGFASSHHFVAFMRGESAWNATVLEPVAVDAATAEVAAARAPPAYVAALLLAQPLHFGDYGGLPLKVLWGVLDGLGIVVLGSGLYLWWRRSDRSFEAWLRQVQAPGRAEAPDEGAAA